VRPAAILLPVEPRSERAGGRRFRALYFAGLVALALSCAGCGGGGAGTRPNLVLVTVDTLRADRLSTYGYGRETSPFLDELASEGVVFENAVSQCGTTPQSFSSIMTGLYPYTDDILTKNGGFVFLKGANTTLARWLGEHGYRTHAITSSIQTSPATGLHNGFATFDAPGSGGEAARHRDAGTVTTRAIDWLQGLEGGRPFFLWLHYVDPHHPYKPPEEYAELWDDAEPSEEGQTRTYRYDPRHTMSEPVTDGELAHLQVNYDREIRYTDDQLRRLFDEALGEHMDETLFVFTADHGESLGEHRMIGHNDVFEPILRVPFVLRLPGGGEERRVSEGVMLVDMLPTILELLAVPEPGELRGESLVPCLAGGEAVAPQRMRVAEYPDFRAYYVGKYKVIERALGGERRVWVFDVALDPDEARDLSERRAAFRDEILARGAELAQRSLGASGDDDGEKPEVSEEMLEELRALGY